MFEEVKRRLKVAQSELEEVRSLLDRAGSEEAFLVCELGFESDLEALADHTTEASRTVREALVQAEDLAKEIEAELEMLPEEEHPPQRKSDRTEAPVRSPYPIGLIEPSLRGNPII